MCSTAAATWIALGRSSSLWQWTMMSISGPKLSARQVVAELHLAHL